MGEQNCNSSYTKMPSVKALLHEAIFPLQHNRHAEATALPCKLQKKLLPVTAPLGLSQKISLSFIIQHCCARRLNEFNVVVHT